MKLVTYEHRGAWRLGAVVEDTVVDLVDLAAAKGESLPSDMLSLIEAGPEALETARRLLAGHGPSTEHRAPLS